MNTTLPGPCPNDHRRSPLSCEPRTRSDAAVDQGLEALVVLSITLGLRLREQPKLAWDVAQRVWEDPDGLAQEPQVISGGVAADRAGTEHPGQRRRPGLRHDTPRRREANARPAIGVPLNGGIITRSQLLGRKSPRAAQRSRDLLDIADGSRTGGHLMAIPRGHRLRFYCKTICLTIET